MPEGWEWDETLFSGSAAYYARGRLPYPDRLAEVFAEAADLSGRPRLLDVGCGPGTVALPLAGLFDEVVGVDADQGMVAEATRAAAAAGVTNARWLCRRAEEMGTVNDLGRFRYATFAQSFHWMDREAVARFVMDRLDPGGAFVHVDTARPPAAEPTGRLPHPAPPAEAIQHLVDEFLGPVRRAGQGFLRHGSLDREADVLRSVGYAEPVDVRVPGGQPVERTVDDVVAHTFSTSGAAPHLFGPRLGEFEGRLRGLLSDASSSGRFSERRPEVWLVFYRHPA